VRDGDEERQARPGEVGEVVLTDLHNYGAPFIRYVTGDLAVRLPDGQCACGRWLPRLREVEGRATDTLRDAAGRPIGGLFFIVMFSVLAHKVRAFQVVQRRDRSIDLRIVPGSEFDDSLLALVRRSCAKAIPDVALRTEIVSEIPVGPGGKHRVVVVED
jgi:phenylacetate-CoA ligase